jgi:hypothetical protein
MKRFFITLALVADIFTAVNAQGDTVKNEQSEKQCAGCVGKCSKQSLDRRFVQRTYTSIDIQQNDTAVWPRSNIQQDGAYHFPRRK